MNFDVVYGLVAIALAIIAFTVAPQLWHMSGNDAVCGETVAADSPETNCREMYELFDLNKQILYVLTVIFFIVGIILLIKGFTDR